MSRAILVWDDAVNVAPPGDPADMRPAGIQGDNRNRYGATGTTPTDEYQGAHCGVVAFIWNERLSQSGDLKVDPDAGYSADMEGACGAARTFDFYLGGAAAAPTPLGAIFFVGRIWFLGAGESVSQPLVFNSQGVMPDCQLNYDAAFPPSGPVRVTRLADVGGARQWRVESQGSHHAACSKLDKRGRMVPTGVSYFLPFAFTVTEVPYPWPKYP